MKKNRGRNAHAMTEPTKMEKLLAVLDDGAWHHTRELVRRVGHTFSLAKFNLVRYGYFIAREADPERRRSFRYRLKEHPDE